MKFSYSYQPKNVRVLGIVTIKSPGHRKTLTQSLAAGPLAYIVT